MTTDTRLGRCSVRYAQHTLRNQGYLADHCTGTDRTFDLIAWKKDQVLALCIRTARKPDITRFHTDITRISDLVSHRYVPGITQFWLYHPSGITRYQILPGGAMLIREGT